jgi:hypothetical protein
MNQTMIDELAINEGGMMNNMWCYFYYLSDLLVATNVQLDL